MPLPNAFRPLGGFFGTQLVATAVQLGTGGTSIGNSGTTSIVLPKPPAANVQLVALALNAQVAAASAGGTVLAQVFKRNNQSTPADVTLTATKSLEADVVTVLGKEYAFALSATSVQNLTFLTSDICRCDVVTTNTVDTQPTITLVALWAIVQP